MGTFDVKGGLKKLFGDVAEDAASHIKKAEEAEKKGDLFEASKQYKEAEKLTTSGKNALRNKAKECERRAMNNFANKHNIRSHSSK
ncbi:MAG: hypothetical protein WC464_03250 [Bdellovibrionales bacterium]